MGKNTKRELVVFQDITVEKETQNEKSGQFESCVIMNGDYDGTDAGSLDIFDVLRGNKLKVKIFNAEFLNEYKLKKGMQFNKFGHHPPNQAWTIYYHNLKGGKILAFLKYTWSADTFSKHFATTGEIINSAYDLKNIDITCHSGVKVFQSRWEAKSKNKAVWTCRVSGNDMSKETAQKYLNQFSKDITVDSVKYEVNNGGMHSFTTKFYDLYDLTINVSISKVKTETISIAKAMKEIGSNKYFVDDDKIYLISEREYSEPAVVVVHIKDGLVDKINARYSHYGDKIVGKKITFEKEKEEAESK